MCNLAYSIAFVGLGASKNAGLGGDDGITSSSGVSKMLGVWPGVGDCNSIAAKYGCLCGKGEMSILSSSGPGEEDGIGGVVTQSVYGQFRLYHGFIACQTYPFHRLFQRDSRWRANDGEWVAGG